MTLNDFVLRGFCKRDTINSIPQREYYRLYRIKNRESILARQKTYYHSNPEKMKQYRSKADKAAMRIRSKKYYHSHKDVASEYHRKRYLEQTERFKEMAMAYRKTPSGILTTRRHSLNRISWKKGAKYSITKIKMEKILLKAGGKCTYCSIPISETNFSIDHIKPLSKGGSNHANNLVASCRTCNARKNAKPLKRFLKELNQYGA